MAAATSMEALTIRSNETTKWSLARDDPLPSLPRLRLVATPKDDPTQWNDAMMTQRLRHMASIPKGVVLSTELIRVSVELSLRRCFTLVELREWAKEEQNRVSQANDGRSPPAADDPRYNIYATRIWNSLTFHSAWNTMLHDYRRFPTGPEYYKQLVLQNKLHSVVNIFGQGDGAANNLDALMDTHHRLGLRDNPKILFHIIATVAARAWWTINDRYLQYWPESDYAESHPRYLVRTHPKFELELFSVGCEGSNCFDSKHRKEQAELKSSPSLKGCICYHGDLYEIARQTTTAEFIYCVMARVASAYPHQCESFISGTTKNTFHFYVKDTTTKQKELWLSTSKWTQYPVKDLIGHYNALVGDRRELQVEVSSKRPFGARNNLDMWTQKVILPNYRPCVYAIPSFFHHPFGDPTKPTLRPTDASCVELISWDLCNFLGKTERNALKQKRNQYALHPKPLTATTDTKEELIGETKQTSLSSSLLLPDNTVSTTKEDGSSNSSSSSDKSRKRKRMKSSTKADEHQALSVFCASLSPVDIRYCVMLQKIATKSVAPYLVPPRCLQSKIDETIIPHHQHEFDSALYDEASIGAISPEYLIWCTQSCRNLFHDSSTLYSAQHLKWPTVCHGRGDINEQSIPRSWSDRIEIRVGVFVYCQIEGGNDSKRVHMTMPHRHILQQSQRFKSETTPLAILMLHDALNVIGMRYHDVICTLAHEFMDMKTTVTTSSPSIPIHVAQTFIDKVRDGIKRHEAWLHQTLCPTSSIAVIKSTDAEVEVEGDVKAVVNNNNNNKRVRHDGGSAGPQWYDIALSRAYPKLKRLAQEWARRPDAPFVLSPRPGLGLLETADIEKLLPPVNLEFNDHNDPQRGARPPNSTIATREVRRVRVAMVGGHLTDEDFKWIMNFQGKVKFADSFIASDYIINLPSDKTQLTSERAYSPCELFHHEYHQWYRRVWYPLLLASTKLTIMPVIQGHAPDERKTTYWLSIDSSTPLERMAKETVSKLREWTAQTESGLIKWVEKLDLDSNPNKTEVTVMLNTLLVLLADQPKWATLITTITSTLTRSETSIVDTELDHTPIWWDCRHELYSFLNDTPKEVLHPPLTMEILRRHHDRLSNDHSYMTQTMPQLSSSHLVAHKSKLTAAQRLVRLLHDLTKAGNQKVHRHIQNSLISLGFVSPVMGSTHHNIPHDYLTTLLKREFDHLKSGSGSASSSPSTSPSSLPSPSSSSSLTLPSALHVSTSQHRPSVSTTTTTTTTTTAIPNVQSSLSSPTNPSRGTSTPSPIAKLSSPLPLTSSLQRSAPPPSSSSCSSFGSRNSASTMIQPPIPSPSSGRTGGSGGGGITSRVQTNPNQSPLIRFAALSTKHNNLL